MNGGQALARSIRGQGLGFRVRALRVLRKLRQGVRW